MDPVNTAMLNIEVDDIQPVYLFKATLLAVMTGLAESLYADDEPQDVDWPLVSGVAQSALYDYCVAAIAYAETP